MKKETKNLHVIIPKLIYDDFVQKVFNLYRLKKGSQSDCVVDAISDWLEKSEHEIKLSIKTRKK